MAAVAEDRNDDFQTVIGELEAIASPQSVDFEERSEFAKRLMRVTTWKWMIDNKHELGISKADAFFDDENAGAIQAFALVPPQLQEAKLYASKALPAKSFSKGAIFVSQTWQASAVERARALRSVLYTSAVDNTPACDVRFKYEWAELPLWIDKFSSPQEGAAFEQAKRFGFFFLEYLKLCSNMIVLLSPKYITRLWCRYELAGFMALKPACAVFVEMRTWLDSQHGDIDARWNEYEHIILESSTANAECSYEEDRAILIDLICKNYRSVDAFDDFTKFVLVALIARSFLMTSWLEGCSDPHGLVERAINLASKAGFPDLKPKLEEVASKGSGGGTRYAMQYGRQEFTNVVEPMIRERQLNALLPDGDLAKASETSNPFYEFTMTMA
eukprot:TRINITY_DN74112_c0_g1_i1.p1 TRINITY_DN74112_c0_g1~~TRINITY_DN74112_c0_g1_i1.p1  ORF type:complete len:387 (-),score=69.35 TRINITY_DN74112_c0_g1_i1:164-1324(-)